MPMPPFHLAFPVHDLAAARTFYGGVLGCREGRSSDRWIDFDFFGHQVVAHLTDRAPGEVETNEVDGHAVPASHFGVVLDWEEFPRVADLLKSHEVEFLIEPYIRFEEKPGEQATMFVRDPSGNALEFKSFRDPSQLFAT